MLLCLSEFHVVTELLREIRKVTFLCVGRGSDLVWMEGGGGGEVRGGGEMGLSLFSRPGAGEKGEGVK